ncbi:MAG: hypothetical protein IJW78_05740 [Clostridia bacterium]|nr:hypothetical protein [Clostridia bacterium]MBQ7289208.1 hypothetical protein [Clostridia bacterium]
MEFDEILNKTKDALNLAGEKTGKFVNQQKVKFDLSISKHELDKLYRDLGIAYYNALQEDSKSDFAAGTIEKIKEKLKEISALNEKIENLK